MAFVCVDCLRMLDPMALICIFVRIFLLAKDGLNHMVICRVILGSTETILPGSRQLGSSSGDFDSGVDNQQAPSKYIVWYPDVKTHVLPLYTVTVKMDLNSRGLQRKLYATRPGSEWIIKI
ncbi:uncharacterized protein A4U43_C07F2240 [Asparagus officinalis]|uniref:PARP catalytic domain-containing protein n=1 Tax=Asparagus officinalis TaxID=4686 RepID=A0A5P1E8P4_ASPOF|nr:uncharacterized protein A4U43_C07F2240 [Asparagus officinalis]